MIHKIACAAVLMLPTLLFAEPSYHRVTGVAATDHLNIRSAPHADSQDIGDLAFDARGIEVLRFDDSRKWAQIALSEQSGWVSARYLDSDSVDTFENTTVPIGLACIGTEPFWALQFNADKATYADPVDPDIELKFINAAVAEGRLGNPAWFDMSNAQFNANAVISGAYCSDGMSDRSFGWNIQMRMLSAKNNRYLTGCCHLPRD